MAKKRIKELPGRVKRSEKVLGRIDIKDQDMVTLSLPDAFRFLVSAVRYALGRKSSAVGWTRGQVRSIAPKLAPCQREVIAKSIRECEDYGSADDRREWYQLLNWLNDLNAPAIPASHRMTD